MIFSTDTPEQKRRRVNAIWEHLVLYLNSELSVSGFEQLVLLCFASIGIENPSDALTTSEDLRDGDTMEELAEKYRPSLREVFYWIRPGALVSELPFPGTMMSSLDFLAEHANTSLYYVVNDHSLRPTPTGMLLRRPTIVPSVITGICHLILVQLELHVGRGELLEHLFPITLCERPDCGRFFVVQRVGRSRFCSGSCRSATAKGKLTLPEKAAYMREYRALKEKTRQKKKPPKKKV
jgi:hypothetical protein